MENKLRFSKNYTIRTKDQIAQTLKHSKSEVSIRQHLKVSSKNDLKVILEAIKNSNNCVIARI